jgi:hypothetical protein
MKNDECFSTLDVYDGRQDVVLLQLKRYNPTGYLVSSEIPFNFKMDVKRCTQLDVNHDPQFGTATYIRMRRARKSLKIGFGRYLYGFSKIRAVVRRTETRSFWQSCSSAQHWGQDHDQQRGFYFRGRRRVPRLRRLLGLQIEHSDIVRAVWIFQTERNGKRELATPSCICPK